MYWGLGDSARVVSAWIAIDDSKLDNGCMRAISGTHLTPRIPHRTSQTGNNLLSISQDIDETNFVRTYVQYCARFQESL